MAGLSVDQRAVHLNPVAGNIKSNDKLEPEHQARVEETQRHDQTGGGTSGGKVER